MTTGIAAMLGYPQAGKMGHTLSNQLRDTVADHIDRAGKGDGGHDFGSTGLRMFRFSQVTELSPQAYRPLACVVLQGRKDLYFQDRKIELGRGSSIIVSQHISLASRISAASKEEPYIAIVLPFDMQRLRRLLDKTDGLRRTSNGTVSMRTYPLDEGTHRALANILTLRPGTRDADMLADSYFDEVHARFLLGPAGDDLRHLLSDSSKANRIARTIDHIRSHIEVGSRIEQLVEISGMSSSTLHIAFRQATGKTPIQFQKELRLLQARSRLSSENAPISEIAYSVGYASTTQFSRDYKAKFGVSPREEKSGTISELA